MVYTSQQCHRLAYGAETDDDDVPSRDPDVTPAIAALADDCGHGQRLACLVLTLARVAQVQSSVPRSDARSRGPGTVQRASCLCAFALLLCGSACLVLTPLRVALSWFSVPRFNASSRRSCRPFMVERADLECVVGSRYELPPGAGFG